MRGGPPPYQTQRHCNHLIPLNQDIEKKYPGFIHQKLLQGIKLSHQLQHVVGKGSADDPSSIVRGFRVKIEGELPSALNGYLYSILKSTKAQRRGILTSLLKQFDDVGKVLERENTSIFQ